MLLTLHPGVAAAQQDTTVTQQATNVTRDTARVTYRTQDVIFLSTGRAAGLAVGDTIDVVAPGGAVAARAVIVSVAQRTASAALVPPGAAVAVGQLVRFAVRRPLAAFVAPFDSTRVPGVQVAAAQPDTTAAAPDTGVVAAPAPAYNPAARWRATVQLQQIMNSVGGPTTVTSQLTTGTVALQAPLASWLTVMTRSTTEWRSSSATLAVPGGDNRTMVYQAEARVAPPGSWWNLSLGRFVPADAIGLGFIDGARIEVQPSRSQRLGVVGGFAPDVFTLAPSSAVRRAGAYWALTTPAVSGSLGGAAEWQDGARRRTWVSAQTFWNPSSGFGLYVLTDLDYGSGWQAFRGFQVTDLSAGVRAALPMGFRGGLSVGTNQALRLWQLAQTGDTLPMPGRLVSFTASLGRDALGSSFDLSTSVLKRATDPNPTFQGTLTVFNRRFMIVGMGQHGDLFDYGSLLVRFPIPLGASRFSTSIAFAASGTLLPATSHPLWRYGVRPEISWRLGGGFYLSTSADIGRYVGRSSVFVQGGVAYQLF